MKIMRSAGAAAVLATAAMLAAVGVARAEGQQLLMKGMEATAASGQTWTEAESIPPGARMIMIYGDPQRPGPYVFRVKFPAGYKLPPHRHPDARTVTVLKGTYLSAVGESFDQAKLIKFGPRSYYTTEAGVPHYALAETEVIIEEMGMGPVTSAIEYVNPADDPRK